MSCGFMMKSRYIKNREEKNWSPGKILGITYNIKA